MHFFWHIVTVISIVGAVVDRDVYKPVASTTCTSKCIACHTP